MSKKLLSIIGILLLLAAIVFGIYTFEQRHKNNELLKNPQPKASSNISSPKLIPSFNKEKYSIEDPSSIWIIVNKARPLKPPTYSPADLVTAGNNQQLRKEAADALSNLLADAKLSNLIITPLSGYRSYDTQVRVYNNEVAAYGQSVADTESARPGHSEHQTGLAIDVGGGGCNIDDCFGTTSEGKWVASNAYNYGFIVRYITGKEATTGYRAEPWHLRYVGTELSKEMHAKNIQTLEEFFEIAKAPNYL